MQLVLFMTYGGSLEIWEKAGILERELALYKKYAEIGTKIYVVSYGGKRDQEIAKRFDFITLLNNKSEIHPRFYAWLLPLIHSQHLKKADIFKTNQMYGAHIAHRCAGFFRKPLLVRQGYGHYEHRVEEYGDKSLLAKEAFTYENRYLKKMDAGIFTTEALASRAIERHKILPHKVFVVPNFIDPDIWTPIYKPPEENEKFHIGFFGRLIEQKNLHTLLDAASSIPSIRLTLIGEGPLKSELQELANKKGLDCQFMDRMQQSRLKEVLQSCDLFVLPSHYEGHPKALIEVMAYGMPILGADSPGIREQIIHQKTGLLAVPTFEGLQAGIVTAKSLAAEQRAAMGYAAHEYALARFSLNKVFQKESEILNSVLNTQKLV